MITVNPLEIEGMMFTAIRVELPKTNLLVITNETGYVMCGALDVEVFNSLLADRNVIAARALGVKTIDELLEAPLESVTDASQTFYGWKPGIPVREALLNIA
ncbi:uncharacterized protein JNUCC1_03043 [Lentibacillus sp. JNUCC-1]|uniref:YunC family protein n=1 Tax=Lentibacillus sp. JNUCC-1 TaxID=2654513 RepID=UPI0012E93760|nr:DUF1805 domain-containing protein [Lentibacillus sp. JNUCC-1]MUV39170.1 uncharacterized protein [Lentibacillus sp. JNUCC-1]